MSARRNAEEAGIIGDEIYERDIRRQVEDAHRGEVVAIDVDSGDYAIGDTVAAASKRLRKRLSDAEVWSVRVGYRTLRNFSGRPLRNDRGIRGQALTPGEVRDEWMG